MNEWGQARWGAGMQLFPNVIATRKIERSRDRVAANRHGRFTTSSIVYRGPLPLRSPDMYLSELALALHLLDCFDKLLIGMIHLPGHQ